MKIGIIGWYGSETLGDRAILDGIVCFLVSRYKKVDILLGSLNPFFTNRVIMQEEILFQCNSLSVFDIRDGKALKTAISNIDILVFGGGPLMDSVSEIEIMANAFYKAHQMKKKTVIFGCGLQEQLVSSRYTIWLKFLLDNADLVFWRDYYSAKIYSNIYGRSGIVIRDPAILSVSKYMLDLKKNHAIEEYIAINYRNIDLINADMEYALGNLASEATKAWKKVIMVPMNDFFWGGDDRNLFDRLKLSNNVYIIHKPLKLYDMYNWFYNAKACIGMRYHSVVFQTYLNGNNYILDYTHEGTKKICSFINSIDKLNFYSDRILNINELANFDISDIINTLKMDQHFVFDKPNQYENIIYEYNTCWDAGGM